MPFFEVMVRLLTIQVTYSEGFLPEEREALAGGIARLLMLCSIAELELLKMRYAFIPLLPS